VKIWTLSKYAPDDTYQVTDEQGQLVCCNYIMADAFVIAMKLAYEYRTSVKIVVKL
jgi:hypothetical protein